MYQHQIDLDMLRISALVAERARAVFNAVPDLAVRCAASKLIYMADEMSSRYAEALNLRDQRIGRGFKEGWNGIGY